MAGKNVYVVPHVDGWAIKKEGNKRASNVCDTKKEAQKIAINYAKSEKSELIILNEDGRIGTKNSYGNDPCPPKDKNR
jgi:hypothetical protein